MELADDNNAIWQLVHLYGCEEALSKEWNLFKLKKRFIGEVAQEASTRTEQKWQRQWKQYKDVA